MKTPSLRQRIWYNLGGTLPLDLQDWVRKDLTGRGANLRYVLRVMIPVPLLLLFFLLPGPAWVPAAMIVILLVPTIYFAVALDYVYRRFRLLEHGLDPNLVSRTRHGAQHDREDYERDFGHQ
ncbi:DUF5313 family protein [Nocardia higoensis]|uniref:DUF5313 family protein n=1 Tax=Nocardia higoensis TaxID=228599 RepID=A0ABS0D8Z2_9NOCA|nr:DUF5313 family protein [Nocardia higoensis]MBF6354939.1 DUF5313 family protein [Nocardia higoensis]